MKLIRLDQERLRLGRDRYGRVTSSGGRSGVNDSENEGGGRDADGKQLEATRRGSQVRSQAAEALLLKRGDRDV
jgi:hypothetical protein